MTGKQVDRKLHEQERQAVILIGHGSRAAGADDDMERIAERLRADADGGIVDLCRMAHGTSFGEAFERCVRQGAKTVIVIPYFLHFGVHLRQDIPEMLREAVMKHPDVRLVLGRHLGYDDALAALVERRIAESEALCDIRDLPETPIDCRPDETG
ncbi:MAG: CbiX/SirB N-terminal domain-containing protein [Syntrophales bacterium]|nr:CbiX/SirB N-terminal domain-containing protein [Syntrophales bacterium]